MMKKLWVRRIGLLLSALLLVSVVLGGCAGKEEPDFSKGWSTDNNGQEKDGAEVSRLIAVKPSAVQYEHSKLGYYSFIHYGMNTFTGVEWGTGEDSPSTFCPTTVDTDQWVRVLKESGSKGVIFTAKHHDGFCLFPSKYTDYDIENSPYQNGKGDIVKQMADSCKKYGMKFGIYLSPWDRHEKTYGTNAYNDYFVNQLTELCTNYGELFEIWFDGAKGETTPEDFKYDFDRYYAVIRELQPNCAIANCGPDVRWIGNEGGTVRESEWSVISKGNASVEEVMNNSQQADGENMTTLKSFNHEDQDLGSRAVVKPYRDLQFYPAEADVSLTPGWFNNNEQSKKPKSAKTLMKLYNNTVGGNAYFLLNVPPTKEGVISEKHAKILKQFGEKIKAQTANPVKISTVFTGNAQKMEERTAAEPLGNDDDNSYRFEDDTYIVDLQFGEKTKVKTLVLKEDIRQSQRVEAFDVYAKVGEKYKKLTSSTVIGSRRILDLGNVKADGIRIVFRQSRSNPVLSFIGVYQ